jgi:hypothetical protein
MARNLVTVDLDWRINLAKKGDGELLADLISSAQDRKWLIRHEPLWDFLAAVVHGKVRLPRPRKLTWLAKDRRWQRERAVARAVHVQMKIDGKQRDKGAREYWTRKYCVAYGTTPAAVAAYKHTAKRRR